jgi:hypothetical protein
MAKPVYNNKLRPRKHLLEAEFHGTFGKFDFTDGPILWKNMTDEMLIEYATKCHPTTVKNDLIGELPKPKAAKVSEAPKIEK